ncbi:MAG: sigma-70 region 4 domain-containing protein [Actinomycetota bacterium]|nr:sigma-70 region 4 domain-containing protein [Actinomycetota bacterium]
MPGIEQLPPDQRAVLQLLLKQGRSYDDLSSVLRMDAGAVRDRAHLALETLGPDTDLSDERLDEVADYLLGQQPASARAQTREFLAGSASGRAWARVVAGELRPLGSDGGLPEIPADGEEVEEAFDALEARRERRQDVERSSKLGGILLLAGLGVALAVVIVLLISGGGDDGGEEGNTGQTPPAQAEEPQVVGQINLLPPDGGDSPLGAAQLLATDQGLAIRIVAQGLEPITEDRVYALWLYNSEDDAELLGFPTTGQPTEEQPLLAAQQCCLPATLGEFESLVITAQGRTEETPSSPGEIVLEGPIPPQQPPGEGGAGDAQPPAQQPGG